MKQILIISAAAVLLAFTFVPSSAWAAGVAPSASSTITSGSKALVGETGEHKGLSAACKSAGGYWACGMDAITVVGIGMTVMSMVGSKGTQNAASSCPPNDIMCASGGSSTGGGGGGGGTGSSNNDSASLNANPGPGGNLNIPSPPPGYSYNPNTGMVTTPNGTYPASDYANGQSMANAGIIPKSQIAAVNKKLAAIRNQFKAISMPVQGGGGGGGTEVQYYNPNAGSNMGQPFVPKIQTSGLTRQLADGEVIGAESDNIFAIVHRCYVRLTKQGEFKIKICFIMLLAL